MYRIFKKLVSHFGKSPLADQASPHPSKVGSDQRGSIALHTPIHWQPPIPGTLVKLWHELAHIFGRHGSLVSHVQTVSLRSYAATAVVAVGLGSASYLWPHEVTFAFAHNETCFSNPTFLPWLHATETSDSFTLTHANEVAIGNYPLYSSETCIVQNRPAAENTQETIAIAPLANPLFKKEITVSSPVYPKVVSEPTKTISIAEPLHFELDQPDQQFEYVLGVGSNRAFCAKDRTALMCGVADFGLQQSKKYSVTLERYFNNEPVERLFEKSLKTVESVTVAKTSIKQDEIRYDKPAKLTLNFSKAIESFDGLSLTQLNETGGKDIPIEAAIKGKGTQLLVTFQQELARGARFRLRLNEVVARDKGFLNTSFTREFETSVGPQVVNKSFDSYGVEQRATVSLTFDSAPQPEGLQSFFGLVVNGQSANFSIRASGKTVFITPAQQLPFCQNFRIIVNSGLTNIHGVDDGGGSAHASRTRCYSVSSIGTSRQGRNIWSYSFGSGNTTVAFVGGTHGNEYSSVSTLDAWVDELDRNINDIPNNTRVVVVPLINPDGYAVGSRTNARNVDLNRNFPANNWKEDVIMPDQTLNKGGGGSAPLSEPEASAIASYILALNPRLVLTYHSQGSLVIANESGNSLAKTIEYGQLSGYSALANSELGNTFTYDTTGAFEDWLHDKHGIAAILVELSSHGGNHLYTNRSAMWAMLN